ncbi:MAG: DUF4276 family protein [Deltaproteobacteria bacterium]
MKEIFLALSGVKESSREHGEMRKVIFLLEELSMKAFLEGYLTRLMPDLDFLCIQHEGKQDLEKSIPRKFRAWPGAVFVVLRDNDGADCRAIKARLKRLSEKNGQADVLIRIACQELESWYLGVPETIAEVYSRPKLAELGRKAKYRNPDHLGSPSAELAKLVPEFRKMDGARRMGMSMPLVESENRSRSFRIFVEGLSRMIPNAKIEIKT